MNITYLLDQNQIINGQIVVIFKRDDNLHHSDSLNIPYNEDGSVDSVELENRIQLLYNYVVDKAEQDCIDWV